MKVEIWIIKKIIINPNCHNYLENKIWLFKSIIQIYSYFVLRFEKTSFYHFVISIYLSIFFRITIINNLTKLYIKLINNHKVFISSILKSKFVF